jgi:hypothetical protein
MALAMMVAMAQAEHVSLAPEGLQKKSAPTQLSNRVDEVVACVQRRSLAFMEGWPIGGLGSWSRLNDRQKSYGRVPDT